MKTLEYHTEDKSTWARGPWVSEPDKKQWPDPTTGLPCLILRNLAGVFCGYVGVHSGHALYGEGYEELYDKGVNISVHGGLTYAGLSGTDSSLHRTAHKRWYSGYAEHKRTALTYPRGDSAHWLRDWGKFRDDFNGWRKHRYATGICFEMEEGEYDDFWCFGFDCAHAGDLMPAMREYMEMQSSLSRMDVYRDVKYVISDVIGLAAQLNKLDTASMALPPWDTRALDID